MLAPGPTGRPRKYCSTRCKGLAYRSRRATRLAATKEETLKIASYPNEQAILDRIRGGLYTAQQLIEILTVVENQFVAYRIPRTPMTATRDYVWLGNTELAAVERQLRRILLRVASHLARQPQELQGGPDDLGNPLRGSQRRNL